MTMIEVQAAEGRLVKDAEGRTRKGAWKVEEHDPFWAPLLACGDIVKTQAAPAKAATAPAATPAVAATVKGAAA